MPYLNIGDYKGRTGLSPPAAYPSIGEKDNAFTYLSIPKHHACVYKNYPNPLESSTLKNRQVKKLGTPDGTMNRHLNLALISII